MVIIGHHIPDTIYIKNDITVAENNLLFYALKRLANRQRWFPSAPVRRRVPVVPLQLSTLGELGDDYADLEADLIEVAALMCDLSEYEDELERYVTDRVAFQLTACYEGLLTYAFGFRVADVILQAYQDYEHELGEQLGIPIDPSVEELLSDSIRDES